MRDSIYGSGGTRVVPYDPAMRMNSTPQGRERGQTLDFVACRADGHLGGKLAWPIAGDGRVASMAKPISTTHKYQESGTDTRGTTRARMATVIAGKTRVRVFGARP